MSNSQTRSSSGGRQNERAGVDLDRVEGLPTLPEVITKILELIDDPDISVDRVAEVVEQDPSLVASVLKIVNSPFYGLGNRITSIRHAVVLLGFRTIRNLALSAVLVRSFGRSRREDRISRPRLWRHTVACAVGARVLARITDSWEPEEAFLAGLMHAMGLIVLEQHFHDEFLQVLDLMDAQSMSFLEAQRLILGCTDAAVGGQLAERWNFPVHVVDAIHGQHEPVLAREAPALAALVHLACRMGCGEDEAAEEAEEFWEREPLDLRAMELAGVRPGDPEEFFEEFEEEWRRAQALLGLAG